MPSHDSHAARAWASVVESQNKELGGELLEVVVCFDVELDTVVVNVAEVVGLVEDVVVAVVVVVVVVVVEEVVMVVVAVVVSEQKRSVMAEPMLKRPTGHEAAQTPAGVRKALLVQRRQVGPDDETRQLRQSAGQLQGRPVSSLLLTHV